MPPSKKLTKEQVADLTQWVRMGAPWPGSSDAAPAPAAKPPFAISAKDYDECDLSDDVQIALNDNDRKRANEILAYPWFKDNKAWQKEIGKMLSNGFKMEVESLITKDISYVTEEYVPERLKKKDWLD